MKNKEYPSQKTKEDIQQLQQKLQKEKNQNQVENLKRALFELQTKLEYQLRQEKKQLQQKSLKEQRERLNEFNSGKINWKLKKGINLYPVWEGHYNNVHLFNITQKQQYYELSFLIKNEKSKEINTVQSKAELFLESLFKNNKKI